MTPSDNDCAGGVNCSESWGVWGVCSFVMSNLSVCTINVCAEDVFDLVGSA